MLTFTQKGLERFNNKWVADTTGCWIWTACTLPNGYGQIAIDGRTKRAHRVSYELHIGRIPKGLCVLHTCDVRSCVNPSHLWLGTCKDNHVDMMQKGRGASTKGERNGFSKLTEKQVLEIRAASGFHRQIASRYGIGATQVGRIKRREEWMHITKSPTDKDEALS